MSKTYLLRRHTKNETRLDATDEQAIRVQHPEIGQTLPPLRTRRANRTTMPKLHQPNPASRGASMKCENCGEDKPVLLHGRCGKCMNEIIKADKLKGTGLRLQ